MDNAEMLTPKEVGKRIKERRNEIGISMPELGRRVGVNKSTIQRYETDGVNPNRSMIINGLADALQTTPEWLTGLSEEKEIRDPSSSTPSMWMTSSYRSIAGRWKLLSRT